MYAIEFRTIVKNGTIEIPDEYRERLRQAASGAGAGNCADARTPTTTYATIA